MANHEGNLFRKLSRAIPGTQENERAKAVHESFELKKGEDHERIVNALTKQTDLLRKSNLLIRMGELTREGVRKLDLKTLSPELSDFYSRELSELDKKNPKDNRLASRVLMAAGGAIMDMFEERGPGRQVGTRASLVEINNENLNKMLGWAHVDENAIVTWRTALDQTQDYARRTGGAAGE